MHTPIFLIFAYCPINDATFRHALHPRQHLSNGKQPDFTFLGFILIENQFEENTLIVGSEVNVADKLHSFDLYLSNGSALIQYLTPILTSS